MAVCAPRINLERCTRDGTLYVNGHLMQRPAFAVTTVAPLWTDPDQRGADLLIPDRTGVYPMPRRGTSTTYTLPIVVDGAFSPAGTVNAHMGEGLRANLEWLRANVSGPVSGGDGQRSVLITKPDGSGTLSGRAHVSIRWGQRTREFWRGVLALEVAAGVPLS